MRNIILGTAGHIDHGKSSLVKALTGIDPDRLKEEKERGITIDIGFADLLFPESGLSVGIVDVPGHEKLIRNMLAGAGGIDMVLLVIAADEGIMPQSREHLAICNLLKIKAGMIALTKSDLVEKEWLDLVKDEIKNFVKNTFLENSPIIPVSSKTGENLELLKQEIKTLAMSIAPKTSGGIFRMPVDRVFTMKGFGTVITGTALSGSISIDDPLEILPCNIKTKVRGLHSHGKPIETAGAGQRVAINLQAVEKEDLKRGDVAVIPSKFSSTKTINAFLELLSDTPVLKNKSLVHFYSGTSETIARVLLYEKEELKAGENCFCQFRLQDPVIAMAGDRYIIRRFSPLETLGGGEILDPSPMKRKKKDGIDDLRMLYEGNLEQKISVKIEKAGVNGIFINLINGWINAEAGEIADSLKKLKKTGEIIQHEDIILHKKSLDLLRERLFAVIEAFHKKNPLKHGMPKEEVRANLRIDPRLFNFVLSGLKRITLEKDLIKLSDFKIELSGKEEEHSAKILSLLSKGMFQPPTRDEMATALKIDIRRMNDILKILSKEGKVVRINESIYLSADSYKNMLESLKSFFSKKPEITIAEFRDILNTTRKYALPFLEYLDAGNITLRTGDVRKFLLKG
ncbi:MAG: selenocysteine-specific translation elongation factor [Nitrospirae bacterium GWC2_42_7]|nr:MAG: selenocysteine-specific translation elongation factor [Nitrospirae bacterium GWC2_42_7]